VFLPLSTFYKIFDNLSLTVAKDALEPLLFFGKARWIFAFMFVVRQVEIDFRLSIFWG
jgi:hypothetical protein